MSCLPNQIQKGELKPENIFYPRACMLTHHEKVVLTVTGNAVSSIAKILFISCKG
ncbi:hypothetical protein D3C81_2236560 [compost metagenome]